MVLSEPAEHPLLIVAGNYTQAETWARSQQIPRNRWTYVANVKRFDGVKNRRLVWIGTFWERSDFHEVSQWVDVGVVFGYLIVDRREIARRKHGRKTRTKADPEAGTSPGAVS